MPLEESKHKPGWLFRMLAKTDEASKELDRWLKAHPEASIFGEERVRRCRE